MMFEVGDIHGGNVDVSSSGDNVIVPAVAGRSYILMEWALSVDGDTEITWRGSYDSGPFAMATADSAERSSAYGLVYTSPGQALRLSLGTGVRVTGSVSYAVLEHDGKGVVRKVRRLDL